METRYYDADMRIDYEALKAHALALRNEAIDTFWRQLFSTVSGFIDGLRVDATSHSGGTGLAHSGHGHHRSN